MRVRFFLLFIFSIFMLFPILKTADFPAVTDAEDAKIYTTQQNFDPDTSDVIGISDAGTVKGFAWFTQGFNVINGTGSVDFASPFPVGGDGLNLNTASSRLRLTSNLIMAAGVGMQDTAGASGYLNCNGHGIVLNGDFSTNNQYIEFVDGSARIFANGNAINFQGTGYFKVGDGANFLSIRDGYFRVVQSHSFQFDDPTKTLYLWNSVLNLAEDVVFDFNVSVVGDLLITGTHTICFNREIELNDESKIIVDVGTTFSYGAAASLAYGARRLGTFYFNGCDILIGDNDFNMTDGRVIFENEVTIDDGGNYKEFVIGANTGVDVLGNARVVLENTTTFSIL